MDKALIPLLPLIQQRADQIVYRSKRAGRIMLSALGVGAVLITLVAIDKKRKANKEVEKLATDVNTRNAALYLEAVKPPGILMRILALSPVGVVINAADTVKNWIGIGDNEKILLITDMVEDWAATVKSYSAFTGGRHLNKDIKKKMGSEYPKFVERLAKNTRAVDAEKRRRDNEVTFQRDSDKLRDKIMKYPEGKVMEVQGSLSRDKKLMPKPGGAQLYDEPSHRRAGMAPAGKYLGATTGRFLNHGGKMAMVEMLTAEGRRWAEWNSLTLYSNG
jgi:hypothetical protein